MQRKFLLTVLILLSSTCYAFPPNTDFSFEGLASWSLDLIEQSIATESNARILADALKANVDGSNISSTSFTLSLDQSKLATTTLTNPIVSDYIRFNNNPATYSAASGAMYWDTAHGTMDVQTDQPGVVLQLGQEQHVRVVNKTGSILTDGQVVYINGAQGNRPTVALADCTIGTSANVIGVVTHNIDINAEGFVTTLGDVHDFNTSGFTAGDVLYLSTTPGQLTKTKPDFPNHIVKVATALNSTNAGSIFVKVDNHFDMTDLDDVKITTASLTNDSVLQYNTASAGWFNADIGTKYLKTAGGSMTGTLSMGTSTLIIASSSGVRFDNDLDTGFDSKGGGGRIYFYNNGVESFQVNWVDAVFGPIGVKGNGASTWYITKDAPSSTNPNYSWVGDSTSGLGRYAVGQPSIVANGIEAQRWLASQTYIASGGIKFIGDEDTGIGQEALNCFNVWAGGAKVLRLLPTSTYMGGGIGAGQNNTGDYNCAFGYNAMSATSNMAQSSAFGTAALQNCTGNNNTSIGAFSGFTLSSGVGNVFMGHGSGYNGGTGQVANVNNSIAIGANTYTTASNQVVIGNAITTDFQLGQGGTLMRVTATQTTLTGTLSLIASTTPHAVNFGSADPDSGVKWMSDNQYALWAGGHSVLELYSNLVRVYNADFSIPLANAMGINFNGGLIHWFNVEYNDGDLMSWMSIRGNMPGYGSNDVGMGLRVYGKDSDVTTGRAGSRPYSWERASIMVSTASHNLEFDNQASGTGVLGAISLGLTNKGVRTEAVRFTATQTTFMGLVTASQAHWEDLRFPAQSINLSGLPAAPGLNTTTYYGALDFDDASLHDIAGMAQMPHGWKNSTSVYPHIHYVNGQDQLATAVWELRYKIANVGEAFPTAYTVATLTETMSPASSTHQLGAFPTIDMTGKSDSCVISWWLRRVGTAAGDTATSAVTLLEFDIHYQNESFGSTSETGDH